MSKRKLFKFYYSYYEVAKELSDKDRLEFLWAIMQRQFEGIEPNLKGIAKIAYVGQKHSIDAQIKGWEDKMGEELNPMQPPSAPPMQGASVPPTLQEEEKEEVKVKEKEEEQVELSARDMIFKKWVDYRKQIKKPLKDVSIESLKSTWSSKSDEDLKLIIEQSISNGWQGLFELKQQPHQQSTFQQSKLPNSVYFDPAPDEAAERRLRSQVNMFTDKVKKDYVLGVNYTEDQLQDYLEKNVKNYKRP